MVNKTSQLFSGTEIKEQKDQFFFIEKGNKIPLHPFYKREQRWVAVYFPRFVQQQSHRRTYQYLLRGFGKARWCCTL